VVDDIVNLRKIIETSEYKEMFSFSVYNAWIKKQVSEPLASILSLLKKNLELLSQTEAQIEKQKSSTKEQQSVSTLELQIKRIHMQKRDIERFIPMLETALEKLES
jgi:septal ring factor EnvC (AmiA/AmiB activator)